ncbi:MAG TPA: FHA domain-containing protein [Solirubrobacteraceae bacterium]|nr:FHA domain-containing protein [Solirubrobacteraceae bacterium]
MLDPVSIALKFAFLGVLYLFLLWMARSVLKDLRRAGRGSRGSDSGGSVPADATGLHTASGPPMGDNGAMPRLVVDSVVGVSSGMEYDLYDEATLGRGDVEIKLEDPFASGRHAQISRSGSTLILEDLGSTNGTYLNEELLQGPAPLHAGDRIRIGDSTFIFKT